MKAGTIILIVLLIILALLVAIGVGVWWFFFKPPKNTPAVCKASPFYKNGSYLGKGAVARACAAQQPPLSEKSHDPSISQLVGFRGDLSLSSIPDKFPAWCKNTYYSGKLVNKKSGKYGTLSNLGEVSLSYDKTLPILSWPAEKYSDEEWGVNVYRGFSQDGSDLVKVGKAVFDPIDNTFYYADYSIPKEC